MIPTRFLARLVVVLFAAAGGRAAAEDAAPTGRLTLQDALALALRHNPALAADARELHAREAEARQAARRPNPELALDLENVAGTGPFEGIGALETTLGVEQTLELGGKSGKREEVARRETDVAAREHEIRRSEVLGETAASFAEVLAAQERIALADTLVAVADRVLASVSRRLRTGGGSPVEERRARVALETSRVEHDRAERALDAARARLAASWGGASATFDRVDGELGVVGPDDVPSLDSLMARAPESPRVARRNAELRRQRTARDLAAAAGVPDLTVGAGVRRFGESDDTALLAGVRLPLPLFDRNRDATAAAEARIARAEDVRRDEETRVRREIAEAHAKLAAAANEAASLRDLILPEAELAFTESHEAYVRGRLRLTDVLDAERSYFDLRARHVDVLVEYHVVAAEIGRLLGSPPGPAPSAMEDPR